MKTYEETMKTALTFASDMILGHWDGWVMVDDHYNDEFPLGIRGHFLECQTTKAVIRIDRKTGDIVGFKFTHKEEEQA